MTDVAGREQIMNALLALLQRQCGNTFATYSRRFMTWEQVVNSYQAETVLSLKQPALFLYDGVGFGGGVDRFDQVGRGTPAIVTMLRTIVIYARMPGAGTQQGVEPDVPGGSVYHPLLESVVAALGADAEENLSAGTLTLGSGMGLVSHCVVKGESLIVTGEIDPDQGQGMIVIPLEIMLYPSY
jgi:hypothetical protein